MLVVAPLVVAPMATLKHIEVEPLTVVEPLGRKGAATWMVGHEVMGVDALDVCGQRVPHLGMHVAFDVAPHHPYNIGAFGVAMSQEPSVGGSLFGIHLAAFHHRAPYGHHSDVYSAFLGLADNEIHLAPVGADAVALDDLHLHHIEPVLPAIVQIQADVFPVELMGQQPACVAQPEERPSVGMLQPTVIVGNGELPVVAVGIRCQVVSGLRCDSRQSEPCGENAAFHHAIIVWFRMLLG